MLEHLYLIVLLTFVGTYLPSKFLFGKGFLEKKTENKEKKERRITRRLSANPAHQRSPPHLPSPRPTRRPASTSPSALPFSLPSLTDTADPHGSASIFLAPHRARRELESDPYPENFGISLPFCANRGSIKLFPRSRGLLLHPNRKNQTLGALFKLNWISPRPKPSCHRGEHVLLLLSANQVARRVRGELLVRLVFFFRCLAL